MHSLLIQQQRLLERNPGKNRDPASLSPKTAGVTMVRPNRADGDKADITYGNGIHLPGTHSGPGVRTPTPEPHTQARDLMDVTKGMENPQLGGWNIFLSAINRATSKKAGEPSTLSTTRTSLT